jgi:hypothetical protein
LIRKLPSYTEQRAVNRFLMIKKRLLKYSYFCVSPKMSINTETTPMRTTLGESLIRPGYHAR